jgi:hypothetical protein
MQPRLVVHADWGSAPSKRWLAIARLDNEARYNSSAPCRVGDYAANASDLIPKVLREIGPPW